jgi:phosphoglycerate kinase
MKTLDNYNFEGKRVLVRVDFNVPLNDSFAITDYTRIDAAIPTIKQIVEGGGMPVLMSHLGRPKGTVNDEFSLRHLVEGLSKRLELPVLFAADCMGQLAEEVINSAQKGEVVLLENLRFYNEETDGDIDFARKLSQLGDAYVNDAFGTAHRAHASTAVIAQFFPEDKMFGRVIEQELNAVEKALTSDNRPITAIMGGAKVSDKILLIEQMLDKVDNLLIGGGMAYTFFKALGGKVGDSLVELDKVNLAQTILNLAAEKNVNVQLPVDSITAKGFSNTAERAIADNMEIKDGFMGLDIGPKATEEFATIIKRSRVIIWNGPMGVFEMSNFEKGTKGVAVAVAEATKNGAFSLIGGGDSAAAVNKFGFNGQVSYISTGGGALLEFMEGKVLPGIKAIQD